MFVLSVCSRTAAAGCCHYLSLPRSISRLAALRARASVCVSVYVCFYASASAPRAVFCRNEIASVNLNACFFVFASSTSGTFASSLLTFCAERSASCSLRLSSPSQLTRVHAPVCVCMCVALSVYAWACVYVDALRSKFVLQAPTVYFQTRDITSSLHSHTAIHSINFCPPPWAHFTGVNSSPPFGWVCEPAWICRAGHCRSLLIELKSEVLADSSPPPLVIRGGVRRLNQSSTKQNSPCNSLQKIWIYPNTPQSHTWPRVAPSRFHLFIFCSMCTLCSITRLTTFARGLHAQKLKRSFCFSQRIRVDARMHKETGDEDLR